MQRIGKNHDGYHGETIDIADVLRDCAAAAGAHGWCAEEIPVEPGLSLPTFTRAAAPAQTAPRKTRLYLSTGIHGDEPAGPLAARQLLRENLWPAHVEVVLLPCLNPTGFPLNRRETARGVDLNRQYLNPHAPETRAHIGWLERQSAYDLAICLHEDWEAHGFYLYELNPDALPSHAETLIESVAKVCPIDPSPVIEGRDASGGIIRPSADPRSRPEWPEAFYLFTKLTRLSYTLEAPSDFPLPTRVAALVSAGRAALGRG